MTLIEKLKIFEENKIKEKELLKTIKKRKYLEALEDINKSLEQGLKYGEISFCIDAEHVSLARSLKFKIGAIGFNSATIKMTKSGIKNLEKINNKYKVGDIND